MMASGWDLGAFGGSYISIPSPIQSSTPVALSPASASLIYSPFVVSLSEDALVALQLQLTLTTRSLYYGPIYWKSFTTIGGGVEFTLGINKPVAFSLSFVYALQTKDDERGWFGLGIVRSTFIIPLFHNEEPHHLMLIYPIEIEVRGDYAGIRVGAGLRYSYMKKEL